jgi:O-methyltransferase
MQAARIIDYSEAYLDLLKSALCASLYDESAWRLVEGPKRQDVAKASVINKAVGHLKHQVLRALRSRGVGLVRLHPFKAEARDLGLDWPLIGFTMTGRKRLDALQRCIEDVLKENVPGDFIETGVWRGGSAILMRAVLGVRNVRDRIVWCADSFEGNPVPRETNRKVAHDPDLSNWSYLSVSLDQVKSNFARFNLLDDQVRFLKGWFCDTLPSAPIHRLALLRLDGDLYESTKDALNNLYDKVSSGGYVIIDDYNTWEGCRIAVDEFRETRGILAPIRDIDRDAILWRVQ